MQTRSDVPHNTNTQSKQDFVVDGTSQMTWRGFTLTYDLNGDEALRKIRCLCGVGLGFGNCRVDDQKIKRETHKKNSKKVL